MNRTGRLTTNQAADSFFREAARNAAKLGHAYIGTEHLLLATLSRSGDALELCRSFGLEWDNVYKAVESLVPRTKSWFPIKPTMRTPRAEAVGEIATRVATEQGDSELSPIHFLYGITALQAGGVGQIAIDHCKVDIERLREAVEAALAP